MSETRFVVAPGGRLTGRIRVPGDKSISHRSIMFGSLADGVTEVSGFLEGEDCLATLNAFRAMGVRIDGPDAGRVTIHGVGLHGLRLPAAALDMGNSGTSMRLMSGILSGQAFDTVLTGDASLSKRPMKRVTAPLAQMGARIETTERGTAPLHIRGASGLHGIDYVLPMASAQVKSCLLLAGLFTAFLSLRFWMFFLAFFGLTGLALDGLDLLASSPLAFVLSLSALGAAHAGPVRGATAAAPLAPAAGARTSPRSSAGTRRWRQGRSGRGSCG